MAKPKQSKYSRAHVRSRVRRPKQGSPRGWLYATVGIGLVGALLVVLTYTERQDRAAGSPALGDHWHSYLGVNVCGNWEPPVPTFEGRDGSENGNPRAGIHSHADFLVHEHPFSSDETGKNATLGKYLEYAQSSVSSSSITLWSNWVPDVDKTNGDDCSKGKPGKLQWKVGRAGEPWPTKVRTGNPADYHMKNGDIIAIYFVAAGEALDEPPGAQDSLSSIEDLGGESAISTTTTAPTTTSDPAAPATDPTSSSSSPAGGTTGTP